MQQMLKVKPPSQAAFDALSLGEVMLRLDPGSGRIRNTRSFAVWEGGGEYNVARGLRKCFELRTAIVTKLADNDIGKLVEDLILQGGVSTEFLSWSSFDGVGRDVRNGLNFTERGFGVRGALGVSDRGHTAISQIKPGEIDWEYIFGERGVRWFHTGGIFASLSETTAEVAIEAMKVAKKHGTIISYDLNYRPSLWKSIGGESKAQEVNRKLISYVDFVFGNEEDFDAALRIKVKSDAKNYQKLDTESYLEMMQSVNVEFPNIQAVATSLRTVKSASINHWNALLWTKDGGTFIGNKMENLEVFDRVGGGDSFASGLIYGFLAGRTPQESLQLGIAHGALAMTTPGDTSMVSLAEVQKLAAGGNARVER
jgi:2-dehydro-3-deoxygluconokinase